MLYNGPKSRGSHSIYCHFRFQPEKGPLLHFAFFGFTFYIQLFGFPSTSSKHASRNDRGAKLLQYSKFTIQHSLHTRLLYQHESILSLTADLSDADLKRSLQTGQWSIHDNIAHLGCYQQHFSYRVNRILQEDTPSLKRYRAENDPAFAEWQRMGRQILQETIHADRVMLIDFFENLEDPNWFKNGIHPKLGRLSLMHWLEFFLLHEAHHLYTIFRSRSKQTLPL